MKWQVKLSVGKYEVIHGIKKNPNFTFAVMVSAVISATWGRPFDRWIDNALKTLSWCSSAVKRGN